MSEDEDYAARLKKLSFRAWRRGFKEADLVLGHFADAQLASMAPSELDDFEKLLEVPDHDLYGWITGNGGEGAEYATEILLKVKVFYKTIHAQILP